MPEKVLFTWSGGKDSALALHYIKQSGIYEIKALLTTITEEYSRVSMHGFRKELLEHQAKSLGYPLEEVLISKNCTNDEYDSKMREILKKYQTQGINKVVFGDIFLEDVREYREKNLLKLNMNGIFPLWKKDTDNLAREFIELGFKAIITCVDSNSLDESFVGKEFNNDFLDQLPKNVDPCGENGEFHSFVFDGPIFKFEIPFSKGNVVLRENRFYFCDLIPK